MPASNNPSRFLRAKMKARVAFRCADQPRSSKIFTVQASQTGERIQAATKSAEETGVSVKRVWSKMLG